MISDEYLRQMAERRTVVGAIVLSVDTDPKDISKQVQTQVGDLAAELLALRARTRWIRCSEKLPGLDEVVIVFDAGGGGWSAAVDTDTHMGNGAFVFAGHPTYWLPLPEPPQEGA